MSGTEGTAPAAEMLRWQTPLCELGQIAAALILATMGGAPIAQRSLLPFQLLVRGSTARFTR